MEKIVLFYLKIQRRVRFDGGRDMFNRNLVPFTVIMDMMQIFHITVTA